MRQDIRTMTRAELLGNARVFSSVGVVTTAVIVTLAEITAATWAMAVFFLGAFVAAGGVIGGLYYLVRGLLRPADWRPGKKEWAMVRFDADREKQAIVKMIRAEVPGDEVRVRVRDEALDNPPPVDSRSGVRKFVESTYAMYEQHRVLAKVDRAGREVTITTYIGRPLEFRMPCWARITLETTCKAAVTESARLPPQETRSTLVDRLAAAPDVAARLKPLLHTAYTRGGKTVRHPSPHLEVVPADGGARVIVDTLPAELHGGFTHRLGIAEFCALVDAIETTLQR